MRRFSGAIVASTMTAGALVALENCSLFVSLDGLESADASTDAAVGADAAANDSSAEPDASDASTGDLGCNDPSVLAAYEFDEGSGTIVHDCSPHHYDGNVTFFAGDASAPDWTPGHVGTAIAFHEQACVVVASPALKVGENFSVSAWVNVQSFDESNGNPYIVGRRPEANDGWRLGLDGMNVSFLLALGDDAGNTGNEVDYEAQSAIVSNVWIHVAAVYQTGISQVVYVNGAKTVGSPFAPIEIEDNVVTVRIGCKGDNSGEIDATIDDVRIFDRALSDAEVNKLFSE